jgi:ubiquinone/menaquinone biosynthesis C-methylase UbiE/uncharacterized protein YbaR (Trm112 family)
MKQFLLDLLECPFCHTFPFRLFAFEKDSGQTRKGCRQCLETEINVGILFCEGCRRWFPVQEGIPSIMPDNLRDRDEFAWLRPFRNLLPGKVYEWAREFSSGCSCVKSGMEENDTDKKKEMTVRNHESGIYDQLFPDDKFKAELETYDRLLQPSSGSLLLDLGCGTGRVTRQILRKCACVVGLDFSFRSLIYCRRHIPPECSHSLHLVHGDVCYLPFRNNLFNDVLSAGLFCNLPGKNMRDMGLAQAARVMKRKGVIVISVYNFSLLKKLRGFMGLAQTGCKEGHKKNGLYYFNHTPQEFVGWLDHYFDVTDLVGTDNRIPLFQHLSPRFNARIDKAISSTSLSLSIFSREMTAKGKKKPKKI